MKALTDYVHSKGLKFGLYNCAGTKTCAGYPGTRGYEYQDARYYASLDIDYLKIRLVLFRRRKCKRILYYYEQSIAGAKRPIVFSLCEWGSNKPWEWAAPLGELWRTTGDIGISFDSSKKIGNWTPNSAMHNMDLQADLNKYAGKNHWNDPDMLEVGNGMSQNEDRAHFTMWCMMAAPLIAGNDITKMSDATKTLLTNKDVIAIDQDTMGVQGFRYAKKDSLETWVKPLGNDGWAVCFLNRNDKPQTVNFNWKEEAVRDEVSGKEMNKNMTYKIQNVWAKKGAGTTAKPFTAQVPPHDVVLLQLSK